MDTTKKGAVFLDRDGVLTVEKGYVTSVEELEIFEYARDAVRIIHEKGYLAIVITNQSAVARGMLSEKELKKINSFLIDKTGVDAVYYCPHHPKGKVKHYTVSCNCRKPKAGLIEKACREYDINITYSYMVGDRACDIQTGICYGLYTVLLESGYGTENLEQPVKPDCIYKDLDEFVHKGLRINLREEAT